MWTNSISQADEQPNLADYAVRKVGFKKIAVLHLNTDWGKTAKDLFVKAAVPLGAEVVASEGYLPDERDFRPTLVRVRDANPDGIVLESYYSDGALIVRQARALGIELPIVSVGSIYSPKFLELGGDAVNGVHTMSNFFPTDPRPEVQSFVTKYRAKYDLEPDSFSAYSYDTIVLMAAVMRKFGTDRIAIKDGLAKIENVPSVIFGSVKFDTATRRVAYPKIVLLQVKDGKWAMWDGPKGN
jgi:branched-chain amino acid transport system substrate-binding protein